MIQIYLQTGIRIILSHLKQLLIAKESSVIHRSLAFSAVPYPEFTALAHIVPLGMEGATQLLDQSSLIGIEIIIERVKLHFRAETHVRIYCGRPIS